MIYKLFLLAVKSLRFRKLTIALTIFSLAVSIMLLLAVDTVRVQAKQNFVNTVAGTDLIVGARSGSIQLLLYTIFHLGNATNNVSWGSYQKISKHPRIQWSIPISLGDSHKGYRVVGTTTDFFEFYRHGDHKNLKFLKGGIFENVFDSVLGANVASRLKYQLGQQIIIAHGMGNVSLVEHDNVPFTVAGVLAPTGTPIDDSILIRMQGLEAVHIGWEHGVYDGTVVSTDDLEHTDLQPKTVTAFLLGLKNKHDIFTIQRAINTFKKEPLLAILPGVTLLELWKVVGMVEKILLLIAAFVVATSLLGMLSIILTNLNERRREIAVLRSVGASPRSIFMLLVTESGLLVSAGIVVGLVLLYLVLALMNPVLESSVGLTIELTPPTLFQWLLLGAVLLGGLLIAVIPARKAYNKTLQDGLTIRT